MSAPVSAFTDSAKQTVAEYATKIEEGLKASPEIIATEYARANAGNNRLMEDAGNIAGKLGAKLDGAISPKVRFFKLILAEAQAQVNHGLAPTHENLRGVVNDVLSKTSRMMGKEANVSDADRETLTNLVGKHLNTGAALYPPTLKESSGFKQSPEQLAFVQGEYAKQMQEYERANLAALSGENTVRYLTGNPVTTVRVQPEQTHAETQSEQSVRAVTTVRVQPEQTVTAELTGAAKQVENDLYPQWLELLKSGELTAGARDAKRFISQATFSKGDKTSLTPQEMQRIWLNWQERASNEGVLVANPKYQAGNRQPKYLKAA
jgi:hypothetical protein